VERGRSKKPGQGTKNLFLNSFDPVLKNVDQLVCWKQGFYRRPNFFKITVKFPFSHVAKAESDNPWRRAREHDSVGKIGVFADDDETFLASEVPHLRVARTLSQFVCMANRQAGGERQATRGIFIEKKTFHATS